jgi:taurine--2-oxoglutarate transaminase
MPEEGGDRESYSRLAGPPPLTPEPGFAFIPVPERWDWVGDGPLPSLVATEAIIETIGAENIAAIITETMFGAAGILPHERYLPELRGLTKKHNILWVDDEVINGFGRLGEWFAYQCYPDIEPDIMALGKGINSCALPAGAVVANREIAEYFNGARWTTGVTHEAHPLVCASIVGNIEAMLEDDGLLARVRSRGQYLSKALSNLASDHPCMGRISGKGLCYAVDLVRADGQAIVKEDRDSRFLGDLSEHPNTIVARECAKYEVHLGGFIPNAIKVAPPLTISEDEIDFAMVAFDKALTVVDETYP